MHFPLSFLAPSQKGSDEVQKGRGERKRSRGGVLQLEREQMKEMGRFEDKYTPIPPCSLLDSGREHFGLSVLLEFIYVDT